MHEPYSKTPDPAFFGPWCHGVSPQTTRGRTHHPKALPAFNPPKIPHNETPLSEKTDNDAQADSGHHDNKKA